MGSSDSLRPGVVASFRTFGVAHHKNKDPDGRLRAHAADRHDRRSPLWPPPLDEVFAGWSITGPGWEGHQQVRSAEAISTSIDMRPASCTSARLRARHNPLFLTDSLTSQFFTDDYDGAVFTDNHATSSLCHEQDLDPPVIDGAEETVPASIFTKKT